MKRAKGPNKPKNPNIASVYPMNMGSGTVILLNDEGRAFLTEQMFIRPVTWDRNHPDFARPEERKIAWGEIRDALLAAGWIQTKVPLLKVRNTITLLKSAYRTKKKDGTFEKHSQNCQWLKKMDSFMIGSLLPYVGHKKILSPGGPCSLEDNMRVLQFYKENEFLWHPKHPDYQDRPIHAEAWSRCQALINKPDMTDEVCKRLAKSLRQRYINRRKSMSPADADQYGQHMEWFKVADSFLGPLLFPVSQELKSEEVKNISVFGEDLPVFDEMEAMPRKLRHMPKEEKYAIYARFMKLYQKMEILWNFSNKNYNSKTLRCKAWALYAQRINIRLIRPSDCREKVKRIKAAYIVRRNNLSPEDLELVFLQPEWFAICESIYGGRTRNTTVNIPDEQDDDLFQRAAVHDTADESEEEVEKVLDQHKRKNHTLSSSDQNSQEFGQAIDLRAPQFPEPLQMGESTHEDEIKSRIVSAFKHYECLWNNKHRDFGLSRRRKVAFSTIAHLVNVKGLTVEDVKAYIRSLKKMFKQIHKTGAPKRPPLWYLILESFLKETLVNKIETRGRKRLSTVERERRDQRNREIEQSIGIRERAKIGKKLPRRTRSSSSVENVPIKREDSFEIPQEFNTSVDLGIDQVIGPEFVVTEVIDSIKKEEDAIFIQSQPAPARADYCRACLQDFHKREDSLKCLKKTSVDGIPFLEIYNRVVGSAYHDSDSHLPEAICNTCFEVVVEFDKFQKKCLASENLYLSNRKITLLEKAKETFPKRQMVRESDSDDDTRMDAGPAFQEYNASDDSFSWEDNLPLKKRNVEADVKPAATKKAKIVEEPGKKQRQPRRPKNIIREVITNTTKQDRKEPDTLLAAALPVDNFDVDDFDLDSYFDNGVVNEQNVKSATKCSTAPSTSMVVQSTQSQIPVVVEDLPTNSSVIREVVTDWVPRQRKTKPPEVMAKEEEQFANYLKEMLETANQNPVKKRKIEQRPEFEEENGGKKYKYGNEVCPECGITGTTSNMVRHMKVHQAPENLFCQAANCQRKKPFLNELQLHQHMMRLHRSECSNNRCEFCEIDFMSRKDRTAHMKAVHPCYRCDICNRSYKTNYLLMYHKNTVHVKERNEDGSALQCDVCQKEFKNYTLMNQHRRRIHFAKQFSCKKCDFSSSSKYQLKKHMITGHPSEDEQYTCHLCEKKFAHLHFLKNHFMARHSTAKKFACQLCTRVFRQERFLGAHYEECHPDDEIPENGD